MVKLTDTHLVCEVMRIVYGRLPEKVIHVWGLPGLEASLSGPRRIHGRRATEDEVRAHVVGFEPGREVIVFVDSSFKRADDPLGYGYHGMVCDTPPKYPLDEFENEHVFAFVVFDTVDAGNVRMIQGRQ